MAIDIFIQHACSYREAGDTSIVSQLMTEPTTSGVDTEKFTPGLVSLEKVIETCRTCPAHFDSGAILSNQIGCSCRVETTVDDVAARILHQTLEENVRRDMVHDGQRNFIHALATQKKGTENRWRALLTRSDSAPENNGHKEVNWSNQPIYYNIRGVAFPMTVDHLLGFLFLRPFLPQRGVNDVLSFFRSFEMVLSNLNYQTNVSSTNQGNQVPEYSPFLVDLRQFLRLLEHASSLGVGVRLVLSLAV